MAKTNEWMTVENRNARLRGRLWGLVPTWDRSASADAEAFNSGSTYNKSVNPALKNADAIVTHIEVNAQHGVRILVGRLFSRHSNIICIRSRNYHGGKNTLGDISFCLSDGDASSDVRYYHVLNAGSPETAAARFVLHAQIGIVCPYEQSACKAAVEQVSAPVANQAFRRAAAAAAHRFVDRGDSAEWIWKSLAQGAPIDARFDADIGEGAA
jgi:hypothetical protein